MLNKILSPIPPEDLKATELQGSHASGGAASITKHSLFSPLLQRNFEVGERDHPAGMRGGGAVCACVCVCVCVEETSKKWMQAH